MQKKCLLHNRFTIGPFKMCGMWFFTSCIPDRIQDAELLAHVIRTANCAFAKRMHRKRVGKEKIRLEIISLFLSLWYQNKSTEKEDPWCTSRNPASSFRLSIHAAVYLP